MSFPVVTEQVFRVASRRLHRCSARVGTLAKPPPPCQPPSGIFLSKSFRPSRAARQRLALPGVVKEPQTLAEPPSRVNPRPETFSRNFPSALPRRPAPRGTVWCERAANNSRPAPRGQPGFLRFRAFSAGTPSRRPLSNSQIVLAEDVAIKKRTTRLLSRAPAPAAPPSRPAPRTRVFRRPDRRFSGSPWL